MINVYKCKVMAKGRGTELNKAERILFLMRCRSQGIKTNSDLLELWLEQWPDLSTSQFYKDMETVKARIMESLENDMNFEASELVRHLWELYNKNLKIQDFRECRAVIAEISKLRGHDVKKIDHTSGGEKITFPFELIKTETETKK